MRARRVQPDEWEGLRDVRLRALRDAPYAFAATVADELAYDETDWREWATEDSTFVVDGEGEFVALAGGYIPSDEPGTAVLIAMWVAPEARGCGIGADLVEAVAGWARAAGATRLRLAVNLANAAAIDLYRRTGFVDTGERQPLRSDPSATEMRMVRELD